MKKTTLPTGRDSGTLHEGTSRRVAIRGTRFSVSSVDSMTGLGG